ncbi:MAG: hypothetical protein AB1894_02325 [Chloroflexota bacterium]
MTFSFLDDLRTCGYYLHPKNHSHAPGYPRLDILLAGKSTGVYFEPESVKLRAISSLGENLTGEIETLEIQHPWRLRNTYRVCVGPVDVWDHRGKVFKAFTFGGALNILVEEDCTVCALESPAPILDLIADKDMSITLAEEVEILLARRRAAWAGKDQEFEKRLANLDPFELYTTCLEVLRGQYEAFPHKEMLSTQHLLRFLRAEIHDLQAQNRWPARLPGIEEIL